MLLQRSQFLLAWELRMSLALGTDTQLDVESYTSELQIHQPSIYQCLCDGEMLAEKKTAASFAVLFVTAEIRRKNNKKSIRFVVTK